MNEIVKNKISQVSEDEEKYQSIDPLQKGVVRLRTAILEYNKKMAHLFYTRSALSCKLVFMGETFVGRLLDLFSTKIKA